MARILICEPHEEVRALLGHVVTRLGHEAVDPSAGGGTDARGHVDVLLLEPADPHALAVAHALRAADETLPIVCASIFPASAHALRLRPVAYLVKPFGLAELERALAAAVDGVSLAA